MPNNKATKCFPNRYCGLERIFGFVGVRKTSRFGSFLRYDERKILGKKLDVRKVSKLHVVEGIFFFFSSVEP